MKQLCSLHADPADEISPITSQKDADSPHLPRRLNALYHSQAHHGPGNQQAHCHLPVETATLRNVVGDVEGLAVPVVGGG